VDVLEWIERAEAQTGRRLASSTAAAFALHAAAMLFLLRTPATLVGESSAFDPGALRFHLGYAGPTQIHPELEVREENSVQSSVYQKAIASQGQARESSSRRRPLRGSPAGGLPANAGSSADGEPDLGVTEDVPDLARPVAGTHGALSFSEDFQIVKLVKPVYPEYELQRGIRAKLIVAVWVTPEGDLENEQIQETLTDPPSASPRSFEIATLDAVRQWRVLPPRRLAQSAGIWLRIPIQFDPERPDYFGQGLQAP
jgi:TonB family protein